jgi:hypothetical protein
MKASGDESSKAHWINIQQELFMYHFIRSVTAKNAASMPAALQFCGEVTAYLNKNYGLNMKAGAQLFGGTKLYWFYEKGNLDEFAQLNAKLMQDRTYWEMLEKAKLLWLEGSMHDKIVTLIG